VSNTNVPILIHNYGVRIIAPRAPASDNKQLIAAGTGATNVQQRFRSKIPDVTIRDGYTLIPAADLHLLLAAGEKTNCIVVVGYFNVYISVSISIGKNAPITKR